MIRAATDADIAAVLALTHAAYAEYDGIAHPRSSALDETPETVAAHLADGGILVDDRDGAIVGAVRYRTVGEALYFHRLSVAPSARRQGVAAGLLAALELRAQRDGLPCLTCRVRLDVATNVTMYTRRGFVQIDRESVCRDGTPVPTGILERRRAADASPITTEVTSK
jgi:ribosomal protein S18 acetylase RimI-like enzyme